MRKFIENLIEKHVGWIMIAIGLTMIVVGAYIQYLNFQECRAHGFSLMYCLFR